MKIFKIFDTEIHDHYIVIGVFATIIILTYIDANYLNTHNCYILEPNIDCASYGTILRQNINATNYVYVDHTISVYGLDEYRSIQGTEHINCQVGNQTCTFHYDVYNGIVGPLNVFSFIGHAAETFDRICWNEAIVQGITPNIYGCSGIPDAYTVVLIWIGVIVLPYYFVKHTYFYLKK